jgi:hypothetical protein
MGGPDAAWMPVRVVLLGIEERHRPIERRALAVWAGVSLSTAVDAPIR